MPTQEPEGAPLVLVVDDNDDNRDIAVQALVHAGFRVDTARDGEEGLQKAADLRPAAIVMDLSMPKVDGWAATAALKASASLRDICVIVVTAHAQAEDHTRALDAGCDLFLVKPVDPVALAKAVGAAIAEPGGHRRAPRPPRAAR